MDRIVFFGTPEFALPTLTALDEAGLTPMVVVSQPARPKGRGRQLSQPPVAEWAIERGIELHQPGRVRHPEFLRTLDRLRPELAIVVAFGQIFPRDLLQLPVRGCVNLHGSLLPQLRGAAPIQGAILAGLKETGATTMQMEDGLDSGPVLLSCRLTIGERETAGELSRRVAVAGAELMVETVRGLEAGTVRPLPQRDELATYAGKVTKADGQVDWSLSAEELFRRLRAYTPWPGLTARWRRRPLKILWAEPAEAATDRPSGEIVDAGGGRLAVACGHGSVLSIERCQVAGRSAVDAGEFVRGARLAVGDRLE